MLCSYFIATLYSICNMNIFWTNGYHTAYKPNGRKTACKSGIHAYTIYNNLQPKEYLASLVVIEKVCARFSFGRSVKSESNKLVGCSQKIRNKIDTIWLSLTAHRSTYILGQIGSSRRKAVTLCLVYAHMTQPAVVTNMRCCGLIKEGKNQM